MSGRPPARGGWRWPAEWESHRATWLSWPHNSDTWPGRLDRVVAAFATMVGHLVHHESVCIAVGDDALEESARKALRRSGVDPERNVSFHRIPTDDAWVRDHGPIFLVRDGSDGRERALADFRFDNWGGKYPGCARDDAVPRAVAKVLGLPRFEADFVLEGGSVDGDGAGSVLTTESCLLNPNRGPDRDRDTMERRLADWLGAERVLWLAGGIEGDDTDGHVDDVARFVAPGTVVAAVGREVSHPDHATLAENRRRLAGMSDARGARLVVVELPLPPRLVVEGAVCPASYVNFYLANRLALVPVFDAPSDARALAILGELLPGREIVGIPCADLVTGLGAIHCLTQQEPDVRD